MAKKARKSQTPLNFFDEEEIQESATLEKEEAEILSVNLDTRKLTKKQQQIVEAKQRNKNKRAALMEAVVTTLRRDYNMDNVLLGKETDRLVFGIPIISGHEEDAYKYPGCLPFEFLIGQNVFPLSLVYQIVAPPGVGKSGFLAEIMRWFHNYGGAPYLFENESKFNPEFYESILSPEVFRAEMVLHRCDSLEDWMQRLKNTLLAVKRESEGTAENPGIGRTMPVIFGIDSIMGKPSEETMAAIFGEKLQSGLRNDSGLGYSERAYPVEALKLTPYLKGVATELAGWPFVLVLINHLKESMATAGPVRGGSNRQVGGGKQIKFQESWELQLNLENAFTSAQYDGNVIRMRCYKNSFAPGDRSATTRMIWWYETDEQTGETIQKTRWDWDWATVKLLNTLLTDTQAHPAIRANLKKIDFDLKVQKTGDVTNTASSKRVGVKEPISWQELGREIRRNQELMEELRNALLIKPRAVLVGDLLEQIEQVKKEIMEKEDAE